MKIYLASSLSRRDNLRNYALELENLGFIVTSRWLQRRADPAHTKTYEDITEGECREVASEDIEDIIEADALVLFTNTALSQRGGKEVELGFALALDKYIIRVGPWRNVFHCLPRVHAVNHFEDAIRLLELVQGSYP